MDVHETSVLENFHRFIGEKLRSDDGTQISPVQALALWRERQETVEAIREGLADIEASRTKPLDEFLADFQIRHGIPNE